MRVCRHLCLHLDHFLMCVLKAEGGQNFRGTAQEGEFVPWGKDSKQDK